MDELIKYCFNCIKPFVGTGHTIQRKENVINIGMQMSEPNAPAYVDKYLTLKFSADKLTILSQKTFTHVVIRYDSPTFFEDMEKHVSEYIKKSQQILGKYGDMRPGCWPI